MAGGPNPYLDEFMEPLNLSDEEIDMLVAFLGSMSQSARDEKPEQGAGGSPSDEN